MDKRKIKKKKQKIRLSEDVSDRLSHLPESLMEQILFFLPSKDAIRVSTLSRTWHRLWNSLPDNSFSFDYREYKLNSLKSNADPGRILLKQEHNFLKSIIDSIQCVRGDRKVKISRFSLRLPSSDQREIDFSYLEDLTELVASKYIRELQIDFSVVGTHDPITWRPLPRTTFAAYSLCVLRLRGCKMVGPFFQGNNTKLPCLQELSLDDCHADKHVLEELLGGCPLLVRFILRNCLGLQNNTTLCIPNLQRLKKVMLDCPLHNYYLDIKTMNLEILDCSSCWRFLDLNTIACNSLKELRMTSPEEQVGQLFAKFQLLQIVNLSLHGSGGLPITINSSYGLKKLNLINCSIDQRKAIININAPNLISYSYFGDSVPSSINMDTPCLQEASLKLKLCLTNNLNTQWFVNLNEYLSQLDCQEVNLFLWIDSSQCTFNPKEWRDVTSCRKISKINHLEIAEIPSKVNYLDLLDGVLWSIHPKILSAPCTFDDTHFEFVKFLCETFTGSKIRKCKNDCKFLCWWHHLKHVKIKPPNYKESNDLKVAMKEGVLEKLSGFYHYLPVKFKLEW